MEQFHGNLSQNAQSAYAGYGKHAVLVSFVLCILHPGYGLHALSKLKETFGQLKRTLSWNVMGEECCSTGDSYNLLCITEMVQTWFNAI